jgi:hypothetical protein
MLHFMKDLNINLKIFCKRFLCTSIIISLLIINTSVRDGHDLVKGNLVQFNDNGAWCWYQVERAVIDVEGGKLIVGSDADGTYKETRDPQKLPSGIYVCRLIIGNYSQTNRMMFIK